MRKYHYCVLYTDVLKQAEVRSVLKKALPGGRGTVFYPCMECYRRDAGGKVAVQPIFPGYIFIRSDMGGLELHEFVRENRGRIMAFVRELGLGRRMAPDGGGFSAREENGEDDMPPGSGEGLLDGAGDWISDLTKEEEKFMDFLLDASGTGSGAGGKAWEDGLPGEENQAAEGLLKMSYGYQEGGRYKVMEGPLRAYEGHIAGVNKHDKKAFLDFRVNGGVVRAGFDVLPKRHWFPEDKGTPEVLADGTEVDLQALAKAMMR